MSIKIKSILIIVLTLVAGVAIGFFVGTMCCENKINKYKKMYKKDDFKEHIYSIVNPDEKQKSLIFPIIDSYSAEFSKEYELFFKTTQNMKDTFEQQMKPYLTPEQLVSLQKFHTQAKKHKKFK